MSDQVASLQVTLDDQATTGADAVTAALNRTADAADAVSVSLDTTETKVTRAGSSAAALANKYDPATQAANALSRAQDALSAATDTVSAEIARNSDYATAGASIIAALTAKVAAAQAVYDQYTTSVSGATSSMQTLALGMDAAAVSGTKLTAVQQSINQTVGVQPANSLFTAARAADVAAYGAALDQLRTKFDPVFAVSKQYESTLNDISAAERVGAISSAVADQARATATAGFQTQVNAANATANAHNALSLATASTTREFVVLGHEALTGNYSRIPGSLLVLAERTDALHSALNYISPLFTGVGIAGAAAAVVVIGGLVAMGVSAENSQAQLASLQNTLRATRDDYTNLATSITAASKSSAANLGLSSTDTLAAGTTIGSSSQFAGTTNDLKDLIATAQNLSVVMGTTLPESAKILRAALDDPAAEAEKLAKDSFPGMTQALADTVKNMQAAGDRGGAFNVVLGTIQAQTNGAKEHLTPLQQALHDLDVAWSTDTSAGTSWSRLIGDAVVSAATIVITSIRGVVQELTDLKNFATHTTAAASTLPSPALQQSTQALMPTISQAAAANNLDDQLLARLQSAEGQQNPDGTWQTSATGAVGPMQITPTTFAGMQSQPQNFPGISALTDLNNPSQNISAGAILFAHLLQKYGDVGWAVLAYHDGEPIVDAALSGNTAATGSAAGLAEVTKVTAGYQGTGRPGSSAAAVQTTPGQSSALGDDMVSGVTASTAGRTQATLNAAQNAYDSSGVLSTQIQANQNLQGTLQAGLDIATQNNDTTAIEHYKEALVAAQSAASGLMTAQQLMARSATDGLAPLNAQSGAARDFATIENNAAIAARDHNAGVVDQTALATELAAKQTQLTTTFNDNVAAVNRDTDAQVAIGAAWDSGAQSAAQATNHTKAMSEALATAAPGTAEYARQVTVLTAAYNANTAAKGDNQTQQELVTQQASLALIQLETSTIAENSDQRAKEIAMLEEKQKLVAAGKDADSAASQAAIANAGAIATATAALQQQQAAYGELASFATSAFDQIGSAITSAITTGDTSALNFGTIVKGVFAEIVQEALKLAVLDPILNDLFGGNRQTLGGVLGSLFSSATSSGSSSSTGSAVTTVGSGVVGGVLKYLGLGSSSSDAGGAFDSAVQGADSGVAASVASGPDVGSAASSAASGLSTAGGSSGLFGTNITGSDALAGLSILGAAASLFEGKGVSVTQGLGVATSAVQLGSTFLSSATTTATAAAQATNTALAGLGSFGPATASEVASVGGTGSLLGSFGVGTSFQGITSAINSAAETLAGGVVDAVQGIGSTVGGLVDSVGTSLGLLSGSTAAATTAVGAATGAATAAADGAAAAGAGATAAGAGASAAADTASTATGAAVSATSTVASYLPYIGTAVSIISDLAQGNYRGAAFVATGAGVGAAIGSIIPGVGTAIGAAVGAVVGGLVDTFFPQHPKNPYEATEVDSDGSGHLAVGPTVAQLIDPSNTIAVTNQWVDNLNTFLDDLHLAITNPAGAVGSVGSGVTGLTQVTDPSNIIPSLRFTSTETQDNLGKTEAGDLPSHSFADADALEAQIVTDAQFANRMDTLGLNLQTVGANLTQISVASVQQVTRANTDAVQSGASLATSDPSTAEFQNLLSDFRTALQTDLPNQVFADETALDAEIDKVYQFIDGTIPSLLAGVTKATSSFQQSVASVGQTYQDAITQAEAYGLSIDQISQLQGAEADSIGKMFQQELDASGGVNDTIAGFTARQDVAAGDQEDADLINYDLQAKNERNAFTSQLTDVYGNAYTSTQSYADQMTELEQTQAIERQAIVQKYADEATATATQAAQTTAAALAQAYDQAAQTVTSSLSNLEQYVAGLATGTTSPLSPVDQATAAQAAFAQQARLAQGGDATAIGNLSTYANTALTATQAIDGNGQAYTDYFNSVTAQLGGVVNTTADTLTGMAMAAIAQTQTDSINAMLATINASVQTLTAETRQAGRAQS